jgi:hypothetical protein
MADSDPGHAQKVTPPPSKVSLPSDTTRSERPPDDKIDAKSELELPDVVVMGKDRMVRMSRDKKTISPESPTLLQPDSPYQPLTTWFRQQTAKPEQQRGNRDVYRSTWIHLLGGMHTSFIAEAGWWQKLIMGQSHLRGWIDHSAGAYDNSQHTLGGASGRLSVEMAPQVTGILSGQYERSGRGLHGSAFSEFKREGQSGVISGELVYDTDTLSDSRIGFRLGGMTLQSDTLSDQYAKTFDFWYQIHSAVAAEWQGIEWTASAHYMRESLELEADTSATRSHLGEIELKAHAPLTNRIAAQAGVAFQATHSDVGGDDSRMAPFARLNLMVSNRLGLTGKISTGYDYQSFSDWYAHNPYVSHRTPTIPSETSLALHLRSDLRVTKRIKAYFRFSRSWMDVMYTWQRLSPSGLFRPMVIKDTRLTEIEAGVSTDISQKTHLQASIVGYSEKIDTESFIPSRHGLPYRPEYRIPVRLKIELLSGFFLDVHADILGERPTKLYSDDRLPSIAVLGTTLSKEYTSFSAVLTVNNVLDTRYVWWEGYLENGITVLAGLQANFE